MSEDKTPLTTEESKGQEPAKAPAKAAPKKPAKDKGPKPGETVVDEKGRQTRVTSKVVVKDS